MKKDEDKKVGTLKEKLCCEGVRERDTDKKEYSPNQGK